FVSNIWIPTYGERIDRLISEIGNHYVEIKRMTKKNRAASILDNHAEGEKPVYVSVPPATPAVAPAKPMSFLATYTCRCEPHFSLFYPVLGRISSEIY
nr:hypothetical protein [Tanacetum cinerariifolium]